MNYLVIYEVYEESGKYYKVDCSNDFCKSKEKFMWVRKCNNPMKLIYKYNYEYGINKTITLENLKIILEEFIINNDDNNVPCYYKYLNSSISNDLYFPQM